MRKFISFLMLFCVCAGMAWGQTWRQPVVSTDTETYLYYIANVRDNDYYVTTTTGLNGGAQQLGSSNTFTEEKAKVTFKLKANGKLYATNVGDTDLIVGYTTTGEAASSVQLFSVDNDYTWNITTAENGGFVLKAGNGNNSWNMHGGKGANIGLYGSGDAGSNWMFIPANDAAAAANIGLITTAGELSNNVVYTVSTGGRGAWLYSSEKNALTSTTKAEVAVNAEDPNQQFAFLKVNGVIYLYSIGAEKFIVKSGDYTTTSETPSETIELITSTGNISPIVVALNGHHVGISNGFDPAVITHYNSTNDGGNQAIIKATNVEKDLTSVIAHIETVQIPMAKAVLQSTIDNANAWLAVPYLAEATRTTLSEGITQATAILNAADATYASITAANTALNNGLKQIAGTEVGGFSNNSIYTLISNRSATAYLMYDGTNDYVASQYKQTELEVGDDKVNCQWAIYKSERGYYYMYNLGANKFMGKETDNNKAIPLSATPVTTELKFKITGVQSHPIMFSSDGNGVVNHSNQDFSTYGVVNWSSGFGNTNDNGNVHKVTVVGTLDDATLTTIAEAVELYETKGFAIQELGDYLTAFYAKYYDAWGSGWRNQPGVNNYSQPANDKPLNEAYDEVKAYYDAIPESATAEEIIAKKTYLESLVANLTINQPENGKFYRLRCVAGQNYLSSTTSAVSEAANAEIRFEISGQDNANPNLMFLYQDNALLSYATGLYINTHAFNSVGASSNVVFTEAANEAVGQYNIQVNGRYIYGQGNTKNNHIDSGAGTPTSTSTNGYNWWLEEVTSLPVAFGEALAATLYAPVALTIPDGVTAYTGSVSGEYVVLTPVSTTIPANTGVILMAEEAKSYDFAVTTTENTVDGNVLTGTVATINTPANIYTLQAPENVLKMKRYNGATLAGFKAYLSMTASPVQAFKLDLGEATGIESILNNANGKMVIYDMNGRRVQQMGKGLYIVNGKKVLVK